MLWCMCVVLCHVMCIVLVLVKYREARNFRGQYFVGTRLSTKFEYLKIHKIKIFSVYISLGPNIDWR